jgi:predicted extracellular nuclease
MPPPAAHDLLITQFATRGLASASDEFLEIYNNTDHILDLSGLHLQYESSTCAAWSDRHVVPNATRLSPGQFYLVASSGYVSPASGPAPDGALGGSGFADNGLLRIADAAGTEIDRVAFGTGLSCSGEGGTVAPNNGTSANGASVVRAPGSYTNATPAQDTDNNRADFALLPARAPRNATAPAQPSKGIIRPAAGELIITQFATRGSLSASDEFVELYNNSTKNLTLDGVKLQYETSSCSSWSDRHTIPAGTTLAPGKFYLAVNPSGYATPASGPTADGNLTTSGFSDNGLLRVVSNTSAQLDLVAYGTGLSCTGEGGTVAPNHGAAANNNSVVRKPADSAAAFSPTAPVRDTDSNSADFAVKTGRSPHGSAAPAQPSR